MLLIINRFEIKLELALGEDNKQIIIMVKSLAHENTDLYIQLFLTNYDAYRNQVINNILTH